VKGYRPEQHCQRCFKGRRVSEFCTPTAACGKPVVFDRMDRYPYVYVCGVGVGPRSELHKQNFHFPLEFQEGRVAEATTPNGYVFRAHNAVAVPIPFLEVGWNGLSKEHRGCKNFQFAVAAFGYPPHLHQSGNEQGF
jgi:hypothetical protein